jgi:DNA-binding PadR family transcriptional regulator
MMNDTLTQDEFDALAQIEGGARHDRVNACVGRNAKRLAGLKMITHGRDGRVALTDKGQQVLLLRRCIDALRALSNDPAATLPGQVAQFLSLKSHIAANGEGGYTITDKGRETLADIDAQRARAEAQKTRKRA